MIMVKKLVQYVLVLMMGIMPFAGIFATESKSVTNNFSTSIDKATESIQDKLDVAPTDTDMKSGAVNRMIQKVIDVVFPVFVVIGLLVAMFGLYTVLSDASKTKEGMMTIAYWIIWILILFSAKYLSSVIFATLWSGGQIADRAPTAATLISNIYTMMVYPFLKLAIYFSLGILVLIMMARVFTYITAQDDSVRKKATGVITWSAVGMIIITGAKQIVEAIYGTQEKVLASNATTLSDIGSRILDPRSIPIIFQVLNWALALISFVLLVMIVFQTYKMLTKPDDESTFKSLKSTIIYAVIGLLLIWAAYLIANLLIIT